MWQGQGFGFGVSVSNMSRGLDSWSRVNVRGLKSLFRVTIKACSLGSLRSKPQTLLRPPNYLNTQY